MRTKNISFLLTVVLGIFICCHSVNATAIYCFYDSDANEFFVVADTKQRGVSADKGETIIYRTMPKWRRLRNGALFAAAGKYVMDSLNKKSIFDLAEDAISEDMPFHKAAETICNINLKYGILELRNDAFNLFEAILLGFFNGKPKMIYFRFPPESQIIDKPYYIKDRMAGARQTLCEVLGAKSVFKRNKNNFLSHPNKKEFLVSIMKKQIDEEPQKVGKPIDILLIKRNNNIEYNQLE